RAIRHGRGQHGAAGQQQRQAVGGALQQPAQPPRRLLDAGRDVDDALIGAWRPVIAGALAPQRHREEIGPVDAAAIGAAHRRGRRVGGPQHLVEGPVGEALADRDGGHRGADHRIALGVEDEDVQHRLAPGLGDQRAELGADQGLLGADGAIRQAAQHVVGALRPQRVPLQQAQRVFRRRLGRARHLGLRLAPALLPGLPGQRHQQQRRQQQDGRQQQPQRARRRRASPRDLLPGASRVRALGWAFGWPPPHRLIACPLGARGLPRRAPRPPSHRARAGDRASRKFHPLSRSGAAQKNHVGFAARLRIRGHETG
ncbi:hypothetical protein HMPREF0731_2838, partial [Pseudoroseomonas cervicalis ATCC 49957]